MIGLLGYGEDDDGGLLAQGGGPMSGRMSWQDRAAGMAALFAAMSAPVDQRGQALQRAIGMNGQAQDRMRQRALQEMQLGRQNQATKGYQNAVDQSGLPPEMAALVRGLPPSQGVQALLPMLQSQREEQALQRAMGGGGAAAGGMPAPSGAPRMAGAMPAGGAAAPAVPPALLAHFEEASRETGIPVPLLVAQAQQESGMRMDRPGRSGEVGIMQIMPSTAQQPGYGVQPADPRRLAMDARENILFGARYQAARAAAANAGRPVDWSDPAQRDRAWGAYNGGGDPNYAQNVARHLPPQGQPGADPMLTPAQSVSGGPPQAAMQPRAEPLIPFGGQMLTRERALQIMTAPGISPQVAQRLQAAIQMSQRGESEPMETVAGPDGRPTLVPRSRAAGLTPARAEDAPRTAERQAQILEERRAGAQPINVNNDRSFGGEISQRAAQRIDDARTAAMAAPLTIESAGRINDALARGAITGTGAELRTSIERALRTAGLIDGERVATTEQLVTELANGTLDIIRRLPGPASDRDVRFAQDAAAGRVSVTSDTLRRMAEIAQRNAERVIREYNSLSAAVRDDPNIPASARAVYAPVEMPAKPGQTAAPDRQTPPPAPPASAAPAIRVRSPEEARRLPSGTRIELPDGSPGVVP